jgi:hypothetical protein
MGCCQCIDSEKYNVFPITTQIEIEEPQNNFNLTKIYYEINHEKTKIPSDKQVYQGTESMKDINVYTLNLPDLNSEDSIKSWKQL